ncbi:AAA family ATPase [Niallia sp. MER TA 168]|uniref:AAA family ATPase n=1 Tax=Niallia sp. MER TA 168 TaxID=2939568 RepID=UPI00203BA77B|nr:AAA family ATPase [Niallia sp. MER TA 168]MCM3364787.1 AAA family ATPase [Niallia sp. MER TA 168]
MAKKNKQRANNIFTKENNQPTKMEKVKKIADQQKQEKEKELLQDERIQQKIEEYEEKKAEYERKIEEKEEEIRNKEAELQIEYETLKNKLKSDIAVQEQQVEREKIKLLEEKRKMVEDREKMIEALKDEEKNIQETYRQELHKIWEGDLQKKLQENQEIVNKAEQHYQETLKKQDEILSKANEKAQEIQEETYQIKVSAEKERLKIIQVSQERMETEYHQVVNELEEKMASLIKKEMELKKRKLEIELQEEDFEFMKQELIQKRAYYEAKLSELSPQKVEALQYEIKSLQELRQLDQEMVRKLKEEIHHLSKYIPDDELRSVNTIVEELESVRLENRRLKDELAQYPSPEELLTLRNSADKVELLQEKVKEEQRLKLEAENRSDSLSIGVIELEQTKRVAETLKTLNAQLQEELKKMNDVYKSTTQSKFPSLIEIDKLIAAQDIIRPTNNKLNLEKLVQYLRSYGASKLGLYYSEKTIRSFIASLAASKLLILQGLSGTGKSSLPRLFKEALLSENTLVPVQPSWRDNRELLGYDNDFTRRFKETIFTKKVYEASAPENQEKIYFIVLDEMNLARIEYYFADFLAVLEERPENWVVPLVSNNDEPNREKRPAYLVENHTSLLVTQNIWFIGTANRDESTFGITDKVYDRAQILNFNSREQEFSVEEPKQLKVSFSEFNGLLEEAKLQKANNLTADEWAQIDLIDEFLRDNLDITFGNRIKMQMDKFVSVYVAAGGTKLEAVDYLISHKVLRKLEGRYETYLKENLKDLIEFLNEGFGNEYFEESKKVLSQKITQLGG